MKREVIEISYQSCMALTDFMQHLRFYLSFTNRTDLTKQLTAWAMKCPGAEWRGIDVLKVQAVARAVAFQTYDARRPMSDILGRYVRMIGGRIFVDDEQRYTHVTQRWFEKDSPLFIGHRVNPGYYGLWIEDHTSSDV